MDLIIGRKFSQTSLVQAYRMFALFCLLCAEHCLHKCVLFPLHFSVFSRFPSFVYKGLFFSLRCAPYVLFFAKPFC